MTIERTLLTLPALFLMSVSVDQSLPRSKNTSCHQSTVWACAAVVTCVQSEIRDDTARLKLGIDRIDVRIGY